LAGLDAPLDNTPYLQDSADALIQSVAQPVAPYGLPPGPARAELELENNTPPAPDACKPAPPPPKPWKGVFYDNDFSFLCNPDYDGPFLWGENLKLIPLAGGCFSTGGELRYRLMDYVNQFRNPYPATNTYSLLRWRHYFDYQATDYARFYLEGIEAVIDGNTLPPTPIDVDEWDLLNAFVDLRVGFLWDNPVWFRYGRQELLYGAQRLISPLDWSNTRRTFEGFKLFMHGEDWDVDAFATRPNRVFPTRFDQPNFQQIFSGLWATYKANKPNVLDLYALYYANDGMPDFDRTTIGSRWYSTSPVKDGCGQVHHTWLAEVQGSYQFGRQTTDDVQAGMFTAGLGYQFNSLPWSPTVWTYYDWASGDRDPGDGQDNTFNQLFPLGHYYLGFFDGIGRQNIIDYNIQIKAQPTKKLSLLIWQHFFNLASINDAVYTASGFAFVPAGTAGSKNVGNELDLLLKYEINPNMDILIGNSWFWNGPALTEATTPRLFDGRLFYTQLTIRY